MKKLKEEKTCNKCATIIDCVATDAYNNKFCAYCGRKLDEKQLILDNVINRINNISSNVKELRKRE